MVGHVVDCWECWIMGYGVVILIVLLDGERGDW